MSTVKNQKLLPKILVPWFLMGLLIIPKRIQSFPTKKTFLIWRESLWKKISFWNYVNTRAKAFRFITNQGVCLYKICLAVYTNDPHSSQDVAGTHIFHKWENSAKNKSDAFMNANKYI